MNGSSMTPQGAGRAWPTLCAVCRAWGRARVCRPCITRHAAVQPRCRRCAIGVAAGTGVCGTCVLAPPPFEHAVTAVDYAFPWSEVVHAFKFGARLDRAGVLADLLGVAVQQAATPRPALVVPVPLSDVRLAERGYNQSWELARRVARRLALAAHASTLRRLVDTPHLAGLPREQRAGAVRGVFDVDPAHAHRVAGRAVALVDDVMTTGATAGAAATALRDAGAASVQLWVFARTARPDA